MRQGWGNPIFRNMRVSDFHVLLKTGTLLHRIRLDLTRPYLVWNGRISVVTTARPNFDPTAVRYRTRSQNYFPVIDTGSSRVVGRVPNDDPKLAGSRAQRLFPTPIRLQLSLSRCNRVVVLHPDGESLASDRPRALAGREVTRTDNLPCIPRLITAE